MEIRPGIEPKVPLGFELQPPALAAEIPRASAPVEERTLPR